MRKILLITIVAMIVMSITFGCKTTEENYREAYELAKKKDSSAVDSTIYARIRNEARSQNVVVGGDTIAMKSEYVKLTEDGGGSAAGFHPYNVVVAQFKQLFNAKSVRKRMIEGGYADAFIVQTREPLYYVVALSSASASEANAVLERLEKQSPVGMKDPCPFLLRKR